MFLNGLNLNLTLRFIIRNTTDVPGPSWSSYFGEELTAAYHYGVQLVNAGICPRVKAEPDLKNEHVVTFGLTVHVVKS